MDMTLREQLDELESRHTVVVTVAPRLQRVGPKVLLIISFMGLNETRTLMLRDQYGLTGQLTLKMTNGRLTWACTGEIPHALEQLR